MIFKTAQYFRKILTEIRFHHIDFLFWNENLKTNGRSMKKEEHRH